MMGMVLAQLLQTPRPLVTPAPLRATEGAVLVRALDDAAQRARRLHGVLGAIVVDLATGASAGHHADERFPLRGAQRLAIAVLAYRAIDAGQMRPSATLERMVLDNDAAAEATLLQALGGASAANADLRALGFGTIEVRQDDRGFATPATMASLLRAINSGPLLSDASRASLLALLARVTEHPGRLRAGLPTASVLRHVTGSDGSSTSSVTNDIGLAEMHGRVMILVAMLRGARGDASARDAVLARVARAAARAARLFAM